jgi:hypothetical protein
MFGEAVRVEIIDVDRYHREVGRILLGERFVNIEMVRDGFEWRYVAYDKTSKFTAATAAREHRRVVGQSESDAALGMASRETEGIEGSSLISSCIGRRSRSC